ncbi:MAG: YkgJ family cysteine cluster protein [Spirochaetales bacterium]|nr:YkgJ family cysteine cluster protein [Spirochaetales bacterium]
MNIWKRWDNICLRCGLCCYEKHHTYRRPGHNRTAPSVSPRFYVDLTEPCPFLDEDSKLCMAYEERFKVCSDCGRLTLIHAVFAGYLPADCGYVRKFQKWRRFIPFL